MINPHNSPWNKPKFVFINDQRLYQRWAAIKKYLTTDPKIVEYNGILAINNKFYIAKKTAKMRLLSHLDWCWYTPKTLAQAIDNNSVESYYEMMLVDARSDPNEWDDKDFEMRLKSYYAERAGRANFV